MLSWCCNRVVALDDDEVDRQLAGLRADFGSRHPDIDATFDEHFELVAHQLPDPAALSAARRALIGAFSTQEFAVEAAALFNPSMVAHPDQRGIAPGDLRFLMSARAVGEGHISCVVFRTGVITADGVVVDEPGRLLGTGRTSASLVSREFVREALAKDGTEHADPILRLLRRHFAVNHLDLAEVALHDHQDALLRAQHAIERIREIAAGHYRLTFAKNRAIAERVIYPTSAGERQGLEDVRLTRFVEESGTVSYLGTYTAFDGSHISPRMLRTKDFRVFEMTPLAGPAARDKGMALFPRAIGGMYFALARWDRESLCLASSDDRYVWDQRAVLAVPTRPWEVIQLGNCGPPIETPRWLAGSHPWRRRDAGLPDRCAAARSGGPEQGDRRAGRAAAGA